MASFLELPGEIRNLIYSTISPLNQESQDYVSMYLSCKQNHHEVLGASVKQADIFFKSVEED